MNTQKFLIDIIKAGEPSTTRLAYYKPEGTNYCYMSNTDGTAAMQIFDAEMVLDINKFNVMQSQELEKFFKYDDTYSRATITDEIREYKPNGKNKKVKGRIIQNIETGEKIMVNSNLLDYFKGYGLAVKGKTDVVKIVVDKIVIGIILPIRYKED